MVGSEPVRPTRARKNTVEKKSIKMKNRGTGQLINALLPGAGHIYMDEAGRGIMWLLGFWASIALLWWIIFIPILIWGLSIFDTPQTK